MVGKALRGGFGGANWTRGVQPCSEVAIGVLWAAGLSSSHTPPGTDQGKKGGAQRAERASVISASLAPGPDQP